MDFTSKLLALSLLFVTHTVSAVPPPASTRNPVTGAASPATQSLGKINKPQHAPTRKKPKAAEPPAQIRIAR